MLGAVNRLVELVKPESIIRILEERLPANFLDMNQKALQLGIDLAEEIA